MKPGETDVKMIPINRMVARSFVTNIPLGQKVLDAADHPDAVPRQSACGVVAWQHRLTRSIAAESLAQDGTRHHFG